MEKNRYTIDEGALEQAILHFGQLLQSGTFGSIIFNAYEVLDDFYREEIYYCECFESLFEILLQFIQTGKDAKAVYTTFQPVFDIFGELEDFYCTFF